jgi:hypothetical protein
MAPRLIAARLAFGGAAILGIVATAMATDASAPAAAAGHSGWLIPAVLALGGLAFLTLALVIADGRPIVLGLALLGAAWLVGLPAAGPWRATTPLAGGWLLAVAELAYWSVDLRVAGSNWRAVYVRRAAVIGGLAGGSTALALVPELGLSPILASGLELTVVGLIGAAALVALAAALAWRLRRERQEPPAVLRH